jgi:hypothetical protein
MHETTAFYIVKLHDELLYQEQLFLNMNCESLSFKTESEFFFFFKKCGLIVIFITE